MLVVGTYERTHIYSLQDGSWEETITVDGSYDNYHLSGRDLLATYYNDTSLASEIYAFNIQDCTQDIPTQSPSLSPTSSPTLSTSPTSKFTCFDEGEGGRNGVLYKFVHMFVKTVPIMNNVILDKHTAGR